MSGRNGADGALSIGFSPKNQRLVGRGLDFGSQDRGHRSQASPSWRDHKKETRQALRKQLYLMTVLS
jgi:hypothetical protein